MATSWWRREAAHVIARTLPTYQAQGLTGKALKRAVGSHYPFGERRNWPYKCWLRELAIAVGEQPRSRPRSRRSGNRDVPGQLLLFQEVF